MADSIRLSFCITTRNRARYIGQTLENVLEQCPPDVEVVVVDGASTDDTVDIVRAIAARYPNLRLITPARNSGLDADYDLAVQEARGTYCWMFTDDDLLVAGAVERVRAACSTDPIAVIPDASVHSVDFSEVEVGRRLPAAGQERYSTEEGHALFRDCGYHLTFIGAVVVRREFWLSRERSAYFGTEFVHCGVLFQAPLPGHTVVIREPLVRIRHGQGNWLERGFEVWAVKWPRLVWSFDWIDESARRRVTGKEPWANPKTLLYYRSKGWYDWALFKRVVVPLAGRRAKLAIPLLIAGMPQMLAQGAVAAGLRILSVGRRMSRTHGTST